MALTAVLVVGLYTVSKPIASSDRNCAQRGEGGLGSKTTSSPEKIQLKIFLLISY